MFQFLFRKKFYLPLAWTLSLSGCIWQAIYITTDYLAYGSVSAANMKRPLTLKAPAVAVCFKREFLVQTTSNDEVRTVRDWFEQTPKVSQLPILLEVHSLTTFTTEWYPKPTVGQTKGDDYDHPFRAHIRMSKFLKQGFVCYSIRLVTTREYPYYLVTNSYLDPKYYSLYLNATYFPDNRIVYIYTYPSHLQFYGISDTFTKHERTFPDTGNSTDRTLNAITLTYAHYMVDRLEYPYITDCFDYATVGFQSKGHCYDSCLTNLTIARLKKVPFDVLINEPIDYQIVGHNDHRNETFKNILRDLEAVCRESCKRSDCRKEEFVPKLISATVNESIVVELYVSNDPYFKNTEKAKISLVEFLTYISSVFGFWISFSPLGLLLYLRKKKIQLTKRKRILIRPIFR